ncbi:MAG: kinase/pyrophosphorylase [Peptostreptococcaceae bacterium]|jgi:putative phosphotransferase CD2411|nr:kinase/pyrophosphorylase [Peptostreptococcaceae bacterium]
METLNICILSDSLGNTAEHVAKAAVAQFKDNDFIVRKFPHIHDEKELDFVLNEISNIQNKIILHTIVKKELVSKIAFYVDENNIKCVDLLTPLLDYISVISGQNPLEETGMLRKMNDRYFKRVESIEFAVKYDDGKDPRGVLKADLVIIGISRTSKTPLSMYLANKNIKVANIPLVPEANLPKELFEIPSKKIIGLTNSPEKLNEIRTERLRAMGLSSSNANENTYANMDRILEEIDYAEGVMKKIGCPIINVANRAIEETAEKIIVYLKRNGMKIYNE